MAKSVNQISKLQAKWKLYSLLLVALVIVFTFWIRGGLNSVYLDTDLGRDLSQLSNFWIGHKVIWLGPTLSPGFHASPLYYYLLYPALLFGKGNAYDFLVANALFSFIVLFVFGFIGIRKRKKGIILASIVLGLTPWLAQLTLHPGNGFTYVLWLLLSLVLLWFELPVYISTLFLGISMSLHPAAAVALPVFIYEWYRKGYKWKHLILMLAGIILPWSPIILFEIITKGFLLREWMAHPGVGLKPGFGFGNIQTLFNSFGLPYYIALILFIVLFAIEKKREKMWIIFCFPGLLLFLVVSKVPGHYLLGLICLIFFTVIVSLLKHKWGTKAFILLILLYLIRAYLAPVLPASRSIGKIQNVVNKVSLSSNLNRTDKIAVVAALNMENKVPQADDYRYFLRIKGYNVLDVNSYKEANKLIMFVENDKFNWENWSTWETDQIGKKQIVEIMQVKDIKAIIYKKI